MSERCSTCHVGSGQVMTVLGPIPVERLGVTLMHEHILNDCRCWWHRPDRARAPASRDRAGASGHPRRAADGPVRQPATTARSTTSRWRSRAAGVPPMLGGAHRGRSHLPRHRPQSRGPARGSRRPPGLQIVMGSGYYLQSSHPPTWSPAMSVGRDRRRDRGRGAARASTVVRIGLIGEIGVSGDFTPDGGEVAARCRPGAGAHRPAADGPSARLVSPRAPRCSISWRRRAAILAIPCSAT